VELKVGSIREMEYIGRGEAEGRRRRKRKREREREREREEERGERTTVRSL
jgi:hypothetical protein